LTGAEAYAKRIRMVTVRFAPSPTGYLHLGSARTALFNWLFARHNDGRFLLRIEDTDLKRSDKKFLDEILRDLRWLGLDWDADPVFQSDRFDVYRQTAAELVAAGRAYRDGEAVLFRVEPGRTIVVEDMIHGRITFQTDDIKDQVLVKSDGSPAYNFSCVVDDDFLGITHILRGDDHISNTPKQVLFYEALDRPAPRFGHMPLIMGQDGAKLSKRHGGVAVEDYKQEGFLAEALANYLILLGWYPGQEHEVLTLPEAVKMFDIKSMNDVQAKFDVQKLKWLNGEYIMRRSAADLLPAVKERLAAAGLAAPDDGFLLKVVELYQIRIKTFNEFLPLTDFFFRDDLLWEEEAKKALAKEGSRELLRLLAARLESLENFSPGALEAACRELAADRKVKAAALIHPARAAVSGKTKGAGLFEIMELLGRERTLERLRSAS
jgi:glutamyl-tRNA synthetase